MGKPKSGTIVAATIAAVALLTAGVLGIRHLDTAQTVVAPPASHTSSAAPMTPAPSPSSIDPPGPPVREAAIDDATVEARILAPRTGERWTTPTPAPDMASLLTGGQVEYMTPYLVGHRGSARIYVVMKVGLGYWPPAAMIAEVDASGARQISCPSARTSDACVPTAGVPGVTLDTSTFYDTLTLPTSIDIGTGWQIDTSQARTSQVYGAARPETDWAGSSVTSGSPLQYVTVATVGGVRVVEEVLPPWKAGLDLDVRSYVVVAPTGLAFMLDPPSAPGGDFESIRWDDGVTRTEDAAFGAYSFAGGGLDCSLGHFSVQPNLDPSQWSRAGTTREGLPVYVPKADNPLVHAIRAVQVEAATELAQLDWYPSTRQARPYLFPSDAAFRDSNALYAVVGPDGVWQIRLRGDAAVRPFSCD
ncbi:MAG TPA: hypothetical protein VGK17_20605 [Propionicimonas sp.]|jgi:hypothetical protein